MSESGLSDEELKRWVRGLNKRGIKRQAIADTLDLTVTRVTSWLRDHPKSWRDPSVNDDKKARALKAWKADETAVCRDIAESIGMSEACVAQWINAEMGPGSVAMRSRKIRAKRYRSAKTVDNPPPFNLARDMRRIG